MAIPTITPLPALDRTDPLFRQKVDTFFASQVPAFVPEANAYAAAIEQALVDAGVAKEGSEEARDQARAIVEAASHEMRRRLSHARQQASFARTYQYQAAGYAASAESSDHSARNAAAAAGAAAGLPEFAGKARHAVRVKEDETGIEYVPGTGTEDIITESEIWTKPPWAAWIEIEGIGGGSGGGAVRSPDATLRAGNGGLYNRILLRAEDVDATVLVTIGAGGLGQISASGESSYTSRSATAGGDSTFGSHLVCPGGIAPNASRVRAQSAYDGGRGGVIVDGEPRIPGGDATQGGAGGGTLVNDAGVSIHGGNGGNGAGAGSGVVIAEPGVAPGGGGGAARNSSTVGEAAVAGDGAPGVIRIRCW